MLEIGKTGATRVTKALSLEGLAQTQACFRESRNPYGQPWEPLKSRSGKPLLKTGRGRASIAVSDLNPADGSFRIGTNVRYMGYHQRGVDATFTRKPSSRLQATKGGRFLSRRRAGSSRAKSVAFVRLNYRGGQVHLVIPQRAFLPIAGRGLGPIWAPAFQRVALDVMAKLSGTGGSSSAAAATGT